MTTAAGTTTSTIGQMVTGIDTDAMVKALVAAATGPQNAVKAKASAATDQLSALKDIGTSMAALQVLTANVASPAGWGARSAVSSNTAIATVTAKDGAPAGSLTFTVDQLASAHALVSGSSITNGSTVVASGGTLNMTIGGQAKAINVGTGTLDQVVSAINSAKLGISAATVNTGSGYRLQLTSTKTGTASTFTVDSGFDAVVGGTVIANQGQDAQLTVGSGAGAYSIASTSNTFADVMPNVTITAVSKSTSPVTTSISSDPGALAYQIQNMVDAANKVISTIQADTLYNASTKTASVLTGDATVERIQKSLTLAMTDAVQQSSLHSPAAAGLSMDATGAITFDQSAFTAAYNADPSAVQSLFIQNGASSTPSMTFIFAGAKSQAGNAAVVITHAATKATDTGLVGSWPLASPPNIAVKIGAKTVNYQVQATDTADQAAAGLQAAITAAGLPLAAAANSDGTGITLSSVGYGAGATFDVAWDGTTFATDSGSDVAGTINGVAAVGSGRGLTLPTSDPQFGGFTIQMNDDSVGAVGSINYEPGLAQRLSSQVASASDKTNGYLSAAQTGIQKNLDSFNATSAAMDLRLQALQTRLTTQFAALQATLARLKDQSNYLQQQIDSIPSINGNGKN